MPLSQRQLTPLQQLLIGCVVVVLIAAEIVLFNTFRDVSQAADSYEYTGYLATDLANIQRELLVLKIRFIEFDIDEEIGLKELEQTRGFAGRQVLVAFNRTPDDHPRKEDLATIRADLLAYDELLSRYLTQTGSEKEETGEEIEALLTQMELEVKLLYDEQEISFFFNISEVLATQRQSQGILLGSSIVLLLLAGGLVFSLGRTITRQFEAAYTQLEAEVAERKLAEQALRVANEEVALRATELEKANQELDHFAYTISHDLKAPLRGIVNLVSWLEEDDENQLSEESQEYLGLLTQRTERMEGLIQGVLAYARVGHDEVEESEVDCGDLVTIIVAGLTPPEGFTIVVADNMPVLRTNEVKLEQVFANLISNAIKYHDRDDGRIEVRYAAKDGLHEFGVIDDGPGIDKAHHEQVFQIFKTLHSRDDVESTGVGLAVVKKIVEEFGGKMRVESALGAGAGF
ncbi:MAG TPA: ATP-binding protein, partial [Anaerolineae bacterium]|nr:ATP-binding protein [Anaerolineae bacterium]